MLFRGIGHPETNPEFRGIDCVMGHIGRLETEWTYRTNSLCPLMSICPVHGVFRTSSKLVPLWPALMGFPPIHTEMPPSRGGEQIRQSAASSGVASVSGVRAAIQLSKRFRSDRTERASISQREPFPGVATPRSRASVRRNFRSVRGSVPNSAAISLGVIVLAISRIPFSWRPCGRRLI